MRLILSFGFLALTAVGCGTGTATAPSKDPNKPNAERKLKVTVPNSESVTQDRTEEVSISISRDHFTGPVAIEFRSLPAGVSVTTQDMVIPADKSDLKVTLKATATAQPAKDHAVMVAARAKDEKDLPEATANFKLDVKSK